jgi:hypothetical protein
MTDLRSECEFDMDFDDVDEGGDLPSTQGKKTPAESKVVFNKKGKPPLKIGGLMNF